MREEKPQRRHTSLKSRQAFALQIPYPYSTVLFTEGGSGEANQHLQINKLVGWIQFLFPFPYAKGTVRSTVKLWEEVHTLKTLGPEGHPRQGGERKDRGPHTLIHKGSNLKADCSQLSSKMPAWSNGYCSPSLRHSLLTSTQWFTHTHTQSVDRYIYKNIQF